MDPLSLTAGVIAILQLAGASGQGLHALLALKDAPQQLQQLWNEAEALRALLVETEYSLHRRRESDGYAQVKASITPVLQTVKSHVLDFEQLIHSRLSHSETLDNKGLPRVKKSAWLRADSEIQRIKQNIRDSRGILQSSLELLGLNDSQTLKNNVLQIQRVTLTSQDTIQEVENRQRELQQEFRQFGKQTQESLEQTQAYLMQREAYTDASLVKMRTEQRQHFAALQTGFTNSMQPLLSQMEQMTVTLNQQAQLQHALVGHRGNSSNGSGKARTSSTVRISATITSEQCPKGCRCQCHTRATIRTPTWLKGVVGQLLWNYNSSISMRSCNYAPCRKSLSKHHFTYYFPSWLVSRAVIVSANLDNLYGTGAKVMVNIPLVVPEESHIVWSLVIAGNLEQLRQLVSRDKNLLHVRNQWGQSLMHVAAKIHQPAVFNFLLSMGMDEHAPDENQKTATTTVLTRRGSEEYDLSIDADDLADRLNWTALHKAAALTREGLQITESLLESEFEYINSRDALGRTPLHWLAENGEADAVRLLTQDPWRADVNTRDNTGFTALHCACWADDVETAAVLLDAGSNPNAQDKHERTPLLHFDDNRLLDLMIEKDADVLISDDEGCNIMHHVAVSDQAILAKTLLERYGHTLCTMNHNGDTPLGLAIQNNSLDVLEVLLPFLEDFPVMPATPVLHGLRAVISDTLLASSVSICLPDVCFGRPNQAFDADTLCEQLEKVGMPNQSKRNALHLAALHATTEAMDMVAAASLSGLDPEARDKDGHSPNECFLKCRNEHCAVVRKSSDLERRSWVRLMRSARGEPQASLDAAEKDEEKGAMVEGNRDKRKDSLFDCVTVVDSDSEDEFVDADDGSGKGDSLQDKSQQRASCQKV